MSVPELTGVTTELREIRNLIYRNNEELLKVLRDIASALERRQDNEDLLNGLRSLVSAMDQLTISVSRR